MNRVPSTPEARRRAELVVIVASSLFLLWAIGGSLIEALA